MFTKGLQLLLPFLVIAGICFFPSCDKEDGDLEAVITVKYLGDTTKIVPFARVNIRKNSINVDGITDLNGQFRHTFKLEAILDVYATIDTGMILTGSTVIRLKPGTTVHRTVYVGQ